MKSGRVTREKLVPRAKITEAQLERLLRHFAADDVATEVAVLTKLNRNTVNRYWGLFRSLLSEETTDGRRKAALDMMVCFGVRVLRGEIRLIPFGEGRSQTLSLPYDWIGWIHGVERRLYCRSVTQLGNRQGNGNGWCNLAIYQGATLTLTGGEPPWGRVSPCRECLSF